MKANVSALLCKPFTMEAFALAFRICHAKAYTFYRRGRGLAGSSRWRDWMNISSEMRRSALTQICMQIDFRNHPILPLSSVGFVHTWIPFRMVSVSTCIMSRLHSQSGYAMGSNFEYLTPLVMHAPAIKTIISVQLRMGFCGCCCFDFDRSFPANHAVHTHTQRTKI